MDFDFDFDFSEKRDEQEITVSNKTSKQHGARFAAVELSDKYIYRRAYSELTLLDTLPKKLEKGVSIHCLTAGDVDALSYLQYILRHSGNVEYLMFSTWCVNNEDVLKIKNIIEAGLVSVCDVYVSEIFKKSYFVEWQMLEKMQKDGIIRRLLQLHNHCKIFAGKAENFSFGIEMSCNFNTNPRIENACITIDDGIFYFYKGFFDDIAKKILKENYED